MNTTLLKQYTTTASAGYLGAIKTTGSHSHKFLYGAELSKEVKNSLTKCTYAGIEKIASISKNSNIHGRPASHNTLKLQKSIYGATLEEYKQTIRERVQHDKILWVWSEENGQPVQVFHEKYWNTDAEGKNKIEDMTADKMAEYTYYTDGETINHHYIGEEPKLNERGKELTKAANEVIRAYNRDDSNAQVDYFDTNFYYDIKIKWI